MNTFAPPRSADRQQAPMTNGSSGPGLDRSDIPAPLPGRPLWATFGTIITIAAIGWGAFNVIELLAHDEVRETATFPVADIGSISVDNDSGSVVVVGTDTDEIALVANVSHGLRRTDYDWRVVGDVLEIESRCPLIGSMWCEVDYRLEVPHDMALRINSDNDRVSVSNIAGDVAIDADNGGLEMVRLSGTVVADTDNGRIEGVGLTSESVTVSGDNGRIELDFAEPPELVDARTDNGSIEIALPQLDGGYDVTTQTDNGSETVDVVDDPRSTYVVRAETDNGSITIRPLG